MVAHVNIFENPKGSCRGLISATISLIGNEVQIAEGALFVPGHHYICINTENLREAYTPEETRSIARELLALADAVEGA